MRFSLRGRASGRSVEVTWEDGRVEGDPLLLDAARALVEQGATVWATPTGPSFSASLEERGAAYATLLAALDAVDEVEGDFPTWPLPEGAQG